MLVKNDIKIRRVVDLKNGKFEITATVEGYFNPTEEGQTLMVYVQEWIAPRFDEENPQEAILNWAKLVILRLVAPDQSNFPEPIEGNQTLDTQPVDLGISG